jgi:hypothetical protein
VRRDTTMARSGAPRVRNPSPQPPELVRPDLGKSQYQRAGFTGPFLVTAIRLTGRKPPSAEVAGAHVVQARETAQCNAAIDAPNTLPGLSALPPCRMTATESPPLDLMVSTGTLKLSLLPVQAPSLIQRRTTLM